MKMTKIESARIIAEQKGSCHGVRCKDCFNAKNNDCGNGGIKASQDQRFRDATAYVKRHESKTKKVKVKTDVRDMANVVKDETKDPTPLEIAKMIRDNGYKFDCNYNETGCGDCKASRFCDTGGFCQKDVIGDYISEHEMVEPVMPEPLVFGEPLPKYVYMIESEGIMRYRCRRFHRSINIGEDGIEHECGRHIEVVKDKSSEKYVTETTKTFDFYFGKDEKPMYKTLADAVKVAESKWEVK